MESDSSKNYIWVNENGNKISKNIKYLSSNISKESQNRTRIEVTFSIEEDHHSIEYKKEKPSEISPKPKSSLHIDDKLIFENNQWLQLGDYSFAFNFNGIECLFYQQNRLKSFNVIITIGGVEIFSSEILNDK
jgi:hypothetical protein